MCCFLSVFAWADDGRTTISLNGEWDFDQTELAFPPRKYTRKIPVPGLVHLARPKSLNTRNSLRNLTAWSWWNSLIS